MNDVIKKEKENIEKMMYKRGTKYIFYILIFQTKFIYPRLNSTYTLVSLLCRESQRHMWV